MPKSIHRCAVCAAVYRAEEEAARCAAKPIMPPRFTEGARVRSPFFFSARHFPNRTEEDNRFEVVEAATPAPSGGDQHDRRVKVRMVSYPNVVHVFLESELDAASS